MKISGEKLAAAREKAGVTRSDLAIAADLSHVRIWQIETSEFSHVNSNIVGAMAKALKTEASALEA